jgi:hypothetical protein
MAACYLRPLRWLITIRNITTNKLRPTCSDETYPSYLLTDISVPNDNFDYNRIENVKIIKMIRNSQKDIDVNVIIHVNRSI